MISAHDASDLEFFFCGSDSPHDLEGFSVDEAPTGPTFGQQLERAALLYCDSRGEVIPPSGRIAEVLREQPDGTYLRGHALWPHALVKRAAPSAPASLPEPTAREVAHERQTAGRSRRDRIADRLGRLDGANYEALRVLHGPRGQQWLQTPRGRVWSLLPLTPVGSKKMLAAMRAAKDAETVPPSQGDWLLALAAGPRPTWLDAALNQAEALERQASRAWAATAPRRPIPTTSSEDA